MESGAQVVTSQMAGSTVVMRAPEPFDGKRTRIFFTFVNNSQFPVNVGPENVTSTQVAVISYDQLIAEQKRSEGVDKFIAALGAVGNTLSASDAGRETTVTSYSGYANCGYGCGGAFSGSAVSSTYSPYAAQQARAQAAAENAAAASEMHSGHASERNAIARNLRTTTVNSGHYITGMLTFELPSAVRRSKKATPITLAIRIGSDVHMLRGFAGPLGAPPPAVSSAATVQITQPMAGSMVPQTTLIASAATGDAFEDNYAYGYRLWEAKSYPQARATLEEILARFPNNKRASYARYLLGRAWLDDKKPANAIKVFYDNYKADPRGDRAPDSLFFLGCGLNDMGKTAEAQEAFVELKRAYQAEVSGRLAPLLAEGCERRGLSNVTQSLPSNIVTQIAPANAPAQSDNAYAAYDRKDVAALSRMAKAGDQVAQFNLGASYTEGRGIAQNYPAAADWYRKAADQGFANAQNNLGYMYESGLGVAQNDPSAAYWYRKAADQGMAEAQNNLGALYTNSRGVAQDYATAVNYFRKAADQGHAGAYRNLGAMYSNGHGVSQDYALAINLFRKAADQGDAEAEYYLGVLYANGRGVPRDDAVAVNFYRKAAEKGHAKARSNLDAMYANGRGGGQKQSAPATPYAPATPAQFSATEFLNNLPKPKD